MQVVKPGAVIAVDAIFIEAGTANRYDPDSVSVTILNSSGVIVDTSTNVIHTEEGVYRFSFQVPLGASLGYWTVRFSGVTEDATTEESVVFEVSNFTAGEEAELLTLLRLRIGERVPLGGSAADTMFSDEEILSVFNSASDVDQATMLLWQHKAAEFASQIDRSESGSEVRLSQLFKNAQTQADRWQATIDSRSAEAASAARVVGQSVAWARPDCDANRVHWTPMGNRA